MRKYIGLFFLFFVLLNVIPGIAFVYPVIIIFVSVTIVYNALIRYRTFEKGNPVARSSNQVNEVAKEIKEKYNTRDPDDTIATYDPALVEINRFGDMTQTTTTTIRLINPPKRLQTEDVMLFLNEGEQIILEPPASVIATVAVYDRSKHLIGYIPKTKNGTMISLINQQKITRGIVTKINRSAWNKYIEIEITYKVN